MHRCCSTPRLHIGLPMATIPIKTTFKWQGLWTDLESEARESKSASRTMGISEKWFTCHITRDSCKCKHSWCWIIKRPVVLFPARFPCSLLISCFPWLDYSREATLISCYVRNRGRFSFYKMGIQFPRALQGSRWGNSYNKTPSLKYCPWYVKNKH